MVLKQLRLDQLPSYNIEQEKRNDLNMKMRRIDHIVLTVSDLEESTRFYHEVFDLL